MLITIEPTFLIKHGNRFVDLPNGCLIGLDVVLIATPALQQVTALALVVAFLADDDNPRSHEVKKIKHNSLLNYF